MQYGSELEGGWKNPPQTTFECLNRPEFLPELDRKEYVVGEAISDPFTHQDDRNQWIYKNHPDKGNSCISNLIRPVFAGIHNHRSFSTSNDPEENDAWYFHFIDPEFWVHYVNCMMAFANHPELKDFDKEMYLFRLTGKYYKSRFEFLPEYQVGIEDKRPEDILLTKTALSFRYHEFGTVENRLCPTFSKPKLSVAFADHTDDCFDSFLKQKKPLTKEQVAQIKQQLQEAAKDYSYQ